MVLSRRIRLLAVLSLVCLLPILSLIYTYRTYAPSSVAARAARGGDVTLPDQVRGGAAAVDLVSPSDSNPPPAIAKQQEEMSAKSAVENAIQQRKNRTVVFSKSYCPYCRRAKQLLDSLDEKYDVYELDQMDEGSDWQAYLGSKTGQSTVPSIFINGEFIGGCSDLESKHRSGDLKKLLSK
ncbi:hypothetical protein JCM10908_005969 [Rhodotorula pacifica]|uniref:glutaredoxin n=1 Tax=Rhodotorula pacifica TaxID=1495444 RepID=UPI00316D1EF7